MGLRSQRGQKPLNPPTSPSCERGKNESQAFMKCLLCPKLSGCRESRQRIWLKSCFFRFEVGTDFAVQRMKRDEKMKNYTFAKLFLSLVFVFSGTVAFTERGTRSDEINDEAQTRLNVAKFTIDFIDLMDEVESARKGNRQPSLLIEAMEYFLSRQEWLIDVDILIKDLNVEAKLLEKPGNDTYKATLQILEKALSQLADHPFFKRFFDKKAKEGELYHYRVLEQAIKSGEYGVAFRAHQRKIYKEMDSGLTQQKKEINDEAQTRLNVAKFTIDFIDLMDEVESARKGNRQPSLLIEAMEYFLSRQEWLIDVDILIKDLNVEAKLLEKPGNDTYKATLQILEKALSQLADHPFFKRFFDKKAKEGELYHYRVLEQAIKSGEYGVAFRAHQRKIYKEMNGEIKIQKLMGLDTSGKEESKADTCRGLF